MSTSCVLQMHLLVRKSQSQGCRHRPNFKKVVRYGSHPLSPLWVVGWDISWLGEDMIPVTMTLEMSQLTAFMGAKSTQ